VDEQNSAEAQGDANARPYDEDGTIATGLADDTSGPESEPEKQSNARASRARHPARIPQISADIRRVAYLSESPNAALGPSNLAPIVRIFYHRFGDTYALELRFPDLQAGYHAPTEHYDSAPATAFASCTAIHSGTVAEIQKIGGFVIRSAHDPPILFTQHLGVYAYEP
jgi:hypothetical protein